MEAPDYQWLVEELGEIKTPEFHRIDKVNCDLTGLPVAYAAFVTQFGSARLYRRGLYYQVGVLAPPKHAVLDGTEVLIVGHSQSDEICFRVDEPNVWSWDGRALNDEAAPFDVWLRTAATRARKSYTSEEWQQIVRGPQPFKPREQQIVDARRQFTWKVDGFDENGDVRVLVRNGSAVTLPFLSIGVRSTRSSFVGRVYLNVEHLAPGDQAIVVHAAYKKQIPRTDLELYDLPDPTPENRELYWELRESPTS